MSDNVIQPDAVAGDRGIPSVNARDTTASSKKAIGFIFALAVIIVGGSMLYLTMKGEPEKKEEETKEVVAPPANSARRFETPPPPPTTLDSTAAPIGLAGDPASTGMVPPPPGVDPNMAYGMPPAAPPASYGNTSTEPAKPRPRLDKGMSDLMVDTSKSASADPAAALAAMFGAPAGGAKDDPGQTRGQGGTLAGLLQGMQTSRVSAGQLGNRNMTIAKGAMIDCVLQTRIDSTHPGMASCITTRDIYSDNGKVLLLERGSLVTGEYQSGIRQGQARLFVLWTRVKTPRGVMINLDSPAADPLGGSGLPGRVNNHFFQRFGAALMLSLIETGLDYAVQQDSSGNNYYGPVSERTRRLSERTLDSSINIPPTLYKRQGERVSIFVARDLYFGDVYGLRVYEGAAP